jgi:hypothetical protein
MRTMWSLLGALALFAVLALRTAPAAEADSIQSVCSSSGVAQTGLQPFATDPPSTGFPPVSLPRCIPGPGAVSSSLSSSGPPGFVGAFFWNAGSTITADHATGFSFTGFAQVSFNNLPADFHIGAVAGTSGTFRDEVTILPPPGISGQAQLVIPMRVTGSATTVGAVAPDGAIGIEHTAEFLYNIASLGSVLFGRSQDTIGLSTTAETLVCGPAACGPAPVLFDETRIVKLPFMFNEQFLIDASFGVDASILPNGPPGAGFLGGSTTADFSHTVTFGPATVVDASGHVIPGVTISSDIDYLAGSAPAPTPAVPEPSTAVLLFSGLFGLGLSAWRQRRRKSYSA